MTPERKAAERIHLARLECVAQHAHAPTVDEMAEIIREAYAELARERDAGWVSVGERLPEKEILVLISTNEGGVFTGKYREYNGKCFWLPTGNATYAANWKVTHWRPLPAPPACGS